MHEEAIDILNLFVEKVERLQSSSLIRTLLKNGSRLVFSWTDQSGILRTTLSGPHTEQVDAFVLTIRLFMQDNDRISIRNAAKLHDSLPVSADLNKYFAMHRANLNQFLEGHSMIGIDGDRPTRREVLETVIYGHLSHLDQAKRQRYQAWMANPMAGSVIDFEFVGVLDMFLRTLVVMAEINRRAVAELVADAAARPQVGTSGGG